MARLRLIPKPISVKNVIPFKDAAEAWFWYVRAERLRREGVRFSDTDSGYTRPCLPDDIYCAVMRLRARRLIGAQHLKVLAEFGWRESPPDSRVSGEEGSVILWNDALDRLTTPLKEKGIVSREDEQGVHICHELY
ncbi:hypothetical protein [Magnetovibrio blakemorei]|uniref:Uncharacterized protein n=1 Tax=Magnetovibrio blakemorei TaxID=28181 RepID=A0A1E5Q853_9PROT|nr:hypothetical protein [Magnetovibrio blakemorei]OEJ67527.1 hypothetical protein BEN30_08805 [Magnetovibrio blakemorei]